MNLKNLHSYKSSLSFKYHLKFSFARAYFLSENCVGGIGEKEGKRIGKKMSG